MKFNILPLIVSLFLTTITYNTYAQNFEWAKQFDTPYILDVVVDDHSNSYSVIALEGTADIDPGSGVLTMTSAGSRDIVIVKLDPLGNLLWAKQIGGSQFETANAIQLDLQGNVYITGLFFSSNVDFDPGPGVVNFSPTLNSHAYVCKFDNLGNLIWARQFASNYAAEGYDLVVSATGEVFFTGQFTDSMDIDPGVGVNYITTGFSTVGSKMFVCQLDANGNLNWGFALDGSVTGRGLGIDLDENSNVYLTGYFNGTGDFDPSPNNTVNLISGIGNKAFLASYTNTGSYRWAHQCVATSPALAEGQDVKVSKQGDVYVTGQFSNTMNFDPSSTTALLTTNGTFDAYVWKFNTAGNFSWVRSFEGTANDFSHALEVDPLGNVYTAGYFLDSTDFDPSNNNSVVVSSGGTDLFVHKMDPMGNLTWVMPIGGVNSQEALAIAISNTGALFVGGYFQGITDFDPSAGVFNLNAGGGFLVDNAFLAKYDMGCFPDQTSIQTEICANSSYTFGGQNLTLAGTYTDTLSNITGCDSIVTLTLSVKSVVTGTDNQTACNTFTWIDGNTYTSSNNSATFNLQGAAANGCDSIVTLNLTILQAATANDNQTACGSFTWIDGNTYTSSNNSATFNLQGAAANGCDSIVTLNLTIITVDSTVQQNGDTLLANASNASYQWIDCTTNQAISGATSASFVPTTSGSYAVLVTQGNCTVQSICYSVFTGVENTYTTSTTWEIYPNPTSDWIHIQFSKAHQLESLQLMDVHGRTLTSLELSEQQAYQINLASYPAGCYYLQAQSRQQRLISPIIKR